MLWSETNGTKGRVPHAGVFRSLSVDGLSYQVHNVIVAWIHSELPLQMAVRVIQECLRREELAASRERGFPMPTVSSWLFFSPRSGCTARNNGQHVRHLAERAHVTRYVHFFCLDPLRNGGS